MSLNVTVLKVINIPGISDSTDLVTVKAHLDEGEGEASVEGVKTTDVKNGATFENSIVFQAKGLGVENLSTYKSVTVRVFAGDKQVRFGRGRGVERSEAEQRDDTALLHNLSSLASSAPFNSSLRSLPLLAARNCYYTTRCNVLVGRDLPG